MEIVTPFCTWNILLNSVWCFTRDILVLQSEQFNLKQKLHTFHPVFSQQNIKAWWTAQKTVNATAYLAETDHLQMVINEVDSK